MAVEQPGAQTPAADPDPASPADSEAADLDEMKRKFREALDRKRGAQAASAADGAPDTGKVHGSHGPAASRRSFRRKSGS
jgi:hypothetical protein